LFDSQSLSPWGGRTVSSAGMAYDWRPTATRTATTTPGVVAVMAPPAEAPSGEIGVTALVEEFIGEAEAGRALNRSGRRYRPSALRDLSGILRYHVVRDLGDLRVEDVRRRHVQALVDRLAADGLSVSRIRSVLSATRALFGYAVEHGHLEYSPADGVAIPRDDEGFDETWSWTEEVPRSRPQPPRVEDDREPIALLPERILSLVLRAVVAVFILIALISLAGSA
jgi:hypothetical protein